MRNKKEMTAVVDWTAEALSSVPADRRHLIVVLLDGKRSHRLEELARSLGLEMIGRRTFQGELDEFLVGLQKSLETAQDDVEHRYQEALDEERESSFVCIRDD